MNTKKQNYLSSIRSDSAYPTFRSVIGIIAILMYVLGGIVVLFGLIGGIGMMTQQFLPGVMTLFISILIGVIYVVIGKIVKEAALMLADIADSITEANSR